MIKDRENLTRLEKVRKIKGLTRIQLVRLSGVSKATIQKLEDSTYPFDDIKLSTLLKLAKALRVKPSEILPIEIARKIK